MKFSPDKLELIKKSSQQHYSNMMMHAIRRANPNTSTGGPSFLLPPDLMGPVSEGSRFPYGPHLTGPRPEDEDDESQDIDLIMDHDDGDTEEGAKIDVESDSDEGSTANEMQQRQATYQMPSYQRVAEAVPKGEQRRGSASGAGVEPPHRISAAEEVTDLDFEVFNRKRKQSNVKGFSIDNIIGHIDNSGGS